MTPQMMNDCTRYAFAALPPIAKREFEAWLRNKLQPFLLASELRDRSKAAEDALLELRVILGTTMETE